MTSKKLRKILGVVVAVSMLCANNTAFATVQFANDSRSYVAAKDNMNSSEDSNSLENKKFSWDNASVYFTLTDRFKNGDTSNDHSYGRSVNEADAGNYQNRMGTFHGGDLKGLTSEVENGYFDKLGINAIWISAPYEQMHGAISGQGFKHYSYHGYYVLDYTNVDANMGTAEDLQNFIDTAHKHGIRVVFDVVMNHAGYADPVTANEYGFGALNSNWKDIYYGWNESRINWFNDYAGEASNNGSTGMMRPNADWTTNWWGSDWIRALGNRFNGYEGSESGDERTMCLSGLPDFKTESNQSVSIPGLLRTKWQREGRFDQEMDELNSFFNRTGKPRTVKNYLIKWLSDWVREYGVDGFRCDTAKHVNLDCWTDLKAECKSALKEWRENNPDKPGAEWKDDFWMTGEVFDHGVYKDNYFTSGAFDSLINFSYMSKTFSSTSAIDGIYSEYAGKINNDDSFNMLSYISSHDKGLSRGDMIKAGTNLLLLPGAIQIYYGDETNRKAVGSNQEQGWRSQMNWDSIDQNELDHWRKIGSFRDRHIAIGAGSHNKISESPYTFSRVYNKNGESDKVVVSEPGRAGSCTVSVGNVFNNGDGIRDAYTGKEYTVSNGTVRVEAGDNGVVLLESNGVVEPSVGVTPGSKEYYTDSVKVTLSANNVASATYSVDGVNKGTFKNGQQIEVGQDKEDGEKTTVEVNGVDKNGKEVKSQKATYTKIPKPKCLTIHVKNDSYNSAPNVYVYSANGANVTKYTGAWPGKAMTSEGDGWYTLDVENTISGKVIFNGQWGQYPESDGLYLEGEVWILNNKIIDKPVQSEKGTVNVKYVDKETGKEIAASSVIEGNVGDNYSVTAKKVKGYKLDSEPDNATGTFAKEGITVTYKYVKDETVKDTLIIHAKNDSWTSAPKAYVYSENNNVTTKYFGEWPGNAMVSEGDGWYTFTTDETESAKVIFSGSWGQYPGVNQPGLDVSGEVWILNNQIIDNPNRTGNVTVKYIDEKTLESISEDTILTGKVGDTYKTSAKDIKGYKLVASTDNVEGKYTDTDTVVTYKYEKENSELTINDFTVKETGVAVRLAVDTNVTENVTYNFWAFTPSGNWQFIKNSSDSYVDWIPEEEGNYILWVYVKDSEGNSVYKTIDYKANKKSDIKVNKVEMSNSKINYKGIWKILKDAVSADDENSSLTFNFNGTGIKLNAAVGTDRGVAKVIIDGKVYSADMYDETVKSNVTVLEVSGLSENSIHTIEVQYTGLHELDSKGSIITIDNFEIVNGNIE